jgi:hypothetical protein
MNMSKFKVGDIVVSNNRGGTDYDVGTLFRVENEDPFRVYPLRKKSRSHESFDWSEEWFELRSPGCNITKQEDNTMYKFDTSSHEAIDFMEIYNDLSRSNPICRVEFRDRDGRKQYYVVAHTSLTNKAEICNIFPPNEDVLWGFKVQLDDPSEYAAWAKWAKNVINAEWPENNPGTVTVTKMEIR